MMCLQIILPNYHPSLPYNINEVYETAKWVLQGTSRMMELPLTVPPPSSAPALTVMKIMPNQGYIKTEQLGAFLSKFTKTIVDTLNANHAHPGPSGGGLMAPQNNKCMFNGCEAFIWDCKAVDEYIKQGKCHHNHEGKVILSSGAFVPQEIQGEFLKDCINE